LLAAELLALAVDALALALSDEAEALADADEPEALAELAADELADPPQAARARHATVKHAITTAKSLAR
jgi:hypothetical protein